MTRAARSASFDAVTVEVPMPPSNDDSTAKAAVDAALQSMRIWVVPAVTPTTSAPDEVATTDPGAVEMVSLHGTAEAAAAAVDTIAAEPATRVRPLTMRTDAAPIAKNEASVERSNR
jgi:hypothetical protein